MINKITKQFGRIKQKGQSSHQSCTSKYVSCKIDSKSVVYTKDRIVDNKYYRKEYEIFIFEQ